MAEAGVDGPVVVAERLEAFGLEALAEAMNRPVQVFNGGVYLRGLLSPIRLEDGSVRRSVY